MPSRSNSSTAAFCARLKRADSLPSFTRSSPDANGDALLPFRLPRAVGTACLRRRVWICHNISLLPRGRRLDCLPPSKYILLYFHKTKHLKFAVRINKVIQARTDHQVSAGLCKLHYFNAIAARDSGTGSSTKTSAKAGPTVNSIIGVIDDATCRSRTISSWFYDACIDVLGLSSVTVDV